MTPSSRQELVAALRSRDPQILGDIVRENSSVLLKVAWGLGWQGPDAEELVQDTFVVMLQSLDRFEGRSTLRTYLIGILYNKSLERRRSQGREQATDPIDEIFEQRFGAGGIWRTFPRGPEDLALAGELKDTIADCLNSLTPSQRLAFSLREIEQNSTEALCNILNVTVTHLGVLLFRARNKMRECIEKKWQKSGIR